VHGRRALRPDRGALNFIHARRILHRDLKPENLLYKDKAAGAPLKLIDFGLALRIGPQEKATEVCGTTSYMAPEVLRGSYATECDIWSLGVITFFMLSGTLPFPGRNDDEKEERIRSEKLPPLTGKHWTDVSNEAKDFIKMMLVPSPRKRLDGRKALKHPWIKNIASLSDQPLSEDVAASLKKYADQGRFQKAIRHQMATHLTTEELHRLRNVFEKLDTEGTGNVSIDALMQTLQDDSVDAAARELISALDLKSFDLDGDGQIDWQEFVAGAMHDHEVYNEDNLVKVFASLDTDKSGTLCQKEVAAILGEDHEFSREMLLSLQKERGDGSGDMKELHMTFEEFKTLMLKGSTLGKQATSTRARRRHHHAPVSKAQEADKV